MSEKCRLCLKEGGKYMNIFKNNVDNDIHFNIMTCIGISIREDDGITDLICLQCFYNVKAFSELRSTAIKNDMLLKDEYAEKKRRNYLQQKEEKESIKPIVNKNNSTHMEDTLATLCLTNIDKIQNLEDNLESTVDKQKNFTPHLQLEKNDADTLHKKLRRKNSKYHTSFIKIKRLYPQINIPEKCFHWNLDPKVIVNRKIVDDWTCIKSHNKTWTVNVCENNYLSPKRLTDFNLKTCDNESDISSVNSNKSFCDLADNSMFSEDNDSSFGKQRFSKKRSINRKVTVVKKARRLSNSSTETATEDSDVTAKAMKRDRKSDKSSSGTESATEDSEASEKSTNNTKRITNIFLPPDVNNSKIGQEMNEASHDEIDQLQDTTIDELLVPTSHENKTFICNTCNLIFDSRKLLNDHKKQHPKDNLRCQLCSESFQIVENLIKHTNAVHSKQNRSSTTPSTSQIKVKTTARKSTGKSSEILKSILKINRNNLLVKPGEQSCEKPIVQQEQVDNIEVNTNENILENLLTQDMSEPSSIKKTTNIPGTENVIVLSDDESSCSTNDKDNQIDMSSNLQISGEDEFLANIYKKHKNRRNQNVYSKLLETYKKLNYDNNVILQGIPNVIDKTYIPVELVARLDKNSMRFRYISTNLKETNLNPKSISYSWSSEKALSPPKKTIDLKIEPVTTAEDFDQMPNVKQVVPSNVCSSSSNQVVDNSKNIYLETNKNPVPTTISVENTANRNENKVNLITQSSRGINSKNKIVLKNTKGVSAKRFISIAPKPSNPAAPKPIAIARKPTNPTAQKPIAIASKPSNPTAPKPISIASKPSNPPNSIGLIPSPNSSESSNTRSGMLTITIQQNFTNTKSQAPDNKMILPSNGVMNTANIQESKIAVRNEDFEKFYNTTQPVQSINITDYLKNTLSNGLITIGNQSSLQNLNSNITLAGANTGNQVVHTNIQTPSYNVPQYTYQQQQPVPNYENAQSNINVQNFIAIIDSNAGSSKQNENEITESRPVIKVKEISKLMEIPYQNHLS